MSNFKKIRGGGAEGPPPTAVAMYGSLFNSHYGIYRNKPFFPISLSVQFFTHLCHKGRTSKRYFDKNPI
jgi:hypothetical protein